MVNYEIGPKKVICGNSFVRGIYDRDEVRKSMVEELPGGGLSIKNPKLFEYMSRD